MGIWRAIGFISLLSFCFNSTSLATPVYITFPSGVDWKTRQSEHFQVLYGKGHKELAERTLLAAESARALLLPLFPESPDKTWIVLGNWEDVVNGYALNLPFPHIVIYPSPPGSTSQLASLGDWLESLILHEYVHILHIYPAKGLWGAMRSVFGSWVLPNGIMPLHFHEGLAVLLESELLPGGRGEGAYFDMLQRVSVAEGQWGTDAFLSRDRMDGTSTIYPYGTSPYFFGYLLHNELWKRKNKEGIHSLVSSYSNNWPTLFDGPLDEVFGTSYEKLWEDVIRIRKVEKEAEIAAIQKQPLSKLEFLTEDRSGKRNLAVSPDGKKVAFRSLRPDEDSEIKILDLASKKITERLSLTQQAAEGLCWMKLKNRDVLVVTRTTQNAATNYYTLAAYDLKKEKWSPLKWKGKPLEHVHQLACANKGRKLLIYQEWGGKGKVLELGLFDKDDELSVKGLRKWDLPTGSWVSSFKVGKPHWMSLRQGVNTELYRWEEGKNPEKALAFKGHLTQFGLGDGATLEAVLDADGRDEIWAIDPEKKTLAKRVAVLSGISAFAPVNEKYLVLAFRHGGYDVAWADKLAEATTREFAAVEPAPERAPINANISEEKNYSALSTILPRMWIPNILIVPAGVQIGAFIPAFDVSQKHVYSIFGGYDTRGRPFADFGYTYRFGEDYGVGGGAYYSPVYIQSTGKFYSIWGGGATLSGHADFIDTSWSIGPAYKNVEGTSFGPQKTSVGVIASLRKNIGVKIKPGAISPHTGTILSLSHGVYLKALGSDDDFFMSTAGVQQFVRSPWAESHSFYLSLTGGYSEGTTLNNAFFQGGGEILFSQQRGSYLNRGFQPGLFLGREMLTFNLEYRFPIVTVERGYGYAPFFLRGIHMALVGDILSFGRIGSVNNAHLLNQFFYSTGVELKSDWKAFFYVPMQFRIGAYHGFGSVGEQLYINFGVLASLL